MHLYILSFLAKRQFVEKSSFSIKKRQRFAQIKFKDAFYIFR